MTGKGLKVIIYIQFKIVLKIYHVAERSANILWNKIKDLNIYAVKVTKPFCAIEKLSQLTLQHKNVLGFPLKQVIDFDIDLLTKGAVDNKDLNEAINSLLPYLKVTKKINVDMSYQCMKKYVLCELIENLFQYISSSVTLEYRSYHHWVETVFGDSSKVICGNLGMGCNESTWYGTVDVRLRGHVPVSSIPVISQEDDENSDESDGASVVVEVKRETAHSSQAISSVVLSSFIEHNLHKDLNSLIPCILINCYSLQIFMYDCEADILFISEKFIFRRDEKVNKESILLLWLFINHR